MFKSFVDLLFIMLMSTIVLLSDSVQIGALNTAPIKIGGGGTLPIRADQISVVIVGEDTLVFYKNNQKEKKSLKNINELADLEERSSCIVLMAADEKVPYGRMMSCWDACRVLGYEAKLGTIAK